MRHAEVPKNFFRLVTELYTQRVQEPCGTNGSSASRTCAPPRCCSKNVRHACSPSAEDQTGDAPHTLQLLAQQQREAPTLALSGFRRAVRASTALPPAAPADLSRTPPAENPRFALAVLDRSFQYRFMPRPKEFDVDQALERALGVFWQKGYEATSMQDLVDAMGIQRASLYGTFGDKHSLYMQALKSYQQRGVEDLARNLATGESPRQALIDLLQDVAERTSGRGGKKGCFCVNAAVEVAPEDRDVQKLLRAHTDHVEELLADTVRRAQKLEQIDADADADELATFLYGLILAMNVLGKQRVPAERMQALVDRGVAALH